MDGAGDSGHLFAMFKAQRRLYIREWRKHRRLTQDRLAARIDMTAANLSRIENGKQDTTLGVLDALADALQCDAADLLNRDPTAPPDRLWAIIRGMKPEVQEQAVKVLQALADSRAA